LLFSDLLHCEIRVCLSQERTETDKSLCLITYYIFQYETKRGLYDGLIIRSEESYRMWRVVVCDQETS